MASKGMAGSNRADVERVLGAFQAAMPALGGALGTTFKDAIEETLEAATSPEAMKIRTLCRPVSIPA